MRGQILFRGRNYVLAQEPAEDVAVDPAATVDDELEGKTAPEEAERGDNLVTLGLEGAGAVEDEEGAGPEPEDPEQLSREIDRSPASNWRQYLQPILKDLKQQFGGVPISLLDPQIESDVDVDLGFHITGYVKFLGEMPHAILDEYGTAPLHFKVFVDPDGKLQRSSVRLYTELD